MIKRMLTPRVLTLSAVAAVLFLVSVPRVHQLALQDNERDAVSTLLILSQGLFGDEVHAAAKELPALDTWDHDVRARLVDARYDPDSALVHRHGYLIEMNTETTGKSIIRAWPAQHGQTGKRAFVYDPERGLLTHSNSGAAWSGLRSQRPSGDESGWQLESAGL